MDLTDQLRRVATDTKEKILTVASDLADADRRSTIAQNGRTVFSQSLAFTTDKAGSVRDAVQKQAPVVAAQVKLIAGTARESLRNSSTKRDREIARLDLEENAVRQRKLVIATVASALQIVVNVRTIIRLRQAAKNK